MPHLADSNRIPGYCGLCIARCGTVATVQDGRFTRLDPDPSHTDRRSAQRVAPARSLSIIGND